MSKKRRPARQSLPQQPERRNPAYSWTRILRLLLVCGIIAYLVYRQQQEQQVAPPPPPDQPSVFVQVEEPTDKAKATKETESLKDSEDSDDATPKAPATLQTIVPDTTIRDRDGNVVHHGPVDLTETIDRIQGGETLDQFDHDGSTFQNRERRLPKKPSGYYREWVHRTPELSGPGPQRIVTGRDGDFWYTPDHYRSFIPLAPGRSR